MTMNEFTPSFLEIFHDLSGRAKDEAAFGRKKKEKEQWSDSREAKYSRCFFLT